MLRGIFFDLDNTLIDRQQAFEGYLVELERRHPRVFDDPQAKETMRELDGHGRRGRPGFCHEVAERFPVLGSPAQVWEDFAGGLTRAVRPQPAVLSLLDRLLERHVLAVVTNGSSRRQREKLERADLLQRLDHLFISEEVGAEKPDPAIFAHALQQTGLQAAEVMFVGDDPERDVAGADASGLRTCWVTLGRSYPIELPMPTLTVERVEGLARFL